MAGGSVIPLIFVSEFTRARMRPKNVILLEINIIVTNFNDVDLLYYLLLDAFARRLRVWCPWWLNGAGRLIVPTRAILSHFVIFPSVCVCFCSTWPEALRPFFLRVVFVWAHSNLPAGSRLAVR